MTSDDPTRVDDETLRSAMYGAMTTAIMARKMDNISVAEDMEQTIEALVSVMDARIDTDEENVTEMPHKRTGGDLEDRLTGDAYTDDMPSYREAFDDDDQ